MIRKEDTTLHSINPWNLKEIEQFATHPQDQVEEVLKRLQLRFEQWRTLSVKERSTHLERVAEVLRSNKRKYAKAITAEMGKPIAEAIAEVEKCAWVCSYYADQAEEQLVPRYIETDGSKSFVQYDPLGVIYAIMPWNFPFWQVFRFAAPTLTAGNTAVLKHAPNVSRCALLIEEIFLEAGLPSDVFRTVLLDNTAANDLIKHPLIKAVSLTGSDRAGEAVAATAGKSLKPSLLELGGSNAVIVLADADLKHAVDTGFKARFLNSGQSCIAGKRFLLEENIYDDFVAAFLDKMKTLRFADPMSGDANIGPLARVDLAEKLEQQVNRSIEMGAQCVAGGKRDGARYEPTVLTEVSIDMPVFKEETFGPVVPFMKIKDLEEAISLSNRSSFGLGVSILTGDPEAILSHATRFDEGAVFINELVKSDPRLPFGGIKRSGYGRELSAEGIHAFVNAKTVYVR
jgi:succinate-semialdehyde dehydrogenase/glutarate-semialdehyde dehydrogenase